MDVRTQLVSDTAKPLSLEEAQVNVVTITADGASGKGFVVDGKGKIASANRLVESATRIKVTMNSGDIFLGKVIRKDASRDLALIQIATDTPIHMALGDTNSVDVGEEVFVFGKAFSGAGKVNRGIITGLRRINGTAFIQMDILEDVENIGGPVMTGQGEVIGMSVPLEGWEADNTGFAVSVNELKAFIYAP